MKAEKNKGFTLIELLVVISIIALVAGISIPSTIGFLKQRRLKAAAQTVKFSCLEARSAAISEREDQYLVFYVKFRAEENGNIQFRDDFDIPSETNLNNLEKKGAPNSVYRFDSNVNTPGQEQLILVQDYPKQMSELLEFRNIAYNDETQTNFALRFRPNGSIDFINIQDKNNDPATSDDTDIVIKQTGVNAELRCFIDIVRNTGQVFFSIRQPNGNES